MILTPEMIMKVENEIANFNNEELLIYNFTYNDLNQYYPNNYYSYMLQRSIVELEKRGLEPKNVTLLQKTS